MRELNIGTKRFTKVMAMDEPGQGGACHEYLIHVNDDRIVRVSRVGFVQFQKGSVKESGVNGCFMEDLLAIVIDRLEGFQSGDFACEENRQVLGHLDGALKLLNQRTKDRQKRGVEGTYKQ